MTPVQPAARSPRLERSGYTELVIASAPTRRTQLILLATLIAYAALVAYGSVIHESWWDEAQAWLIARDAPIGEIFTRDVAYEGHPPLWYLLLAVPAKLGAPYSAMHVVSCLIAVGGVALLMFAFPAVPLAL